MKLHLLSQAALSEITLLIEGAAAAGEQIISVQHDSVRGVTCSIINNTGISCLPGSSLLPQASTTTTTTTTIVGQATRVSLANIKGEEVRSITTPFQGDEKLEFCASFENEKGATNGLDT